MANPQPDEFTKLSNELLDAFMRFRIPGRERQIVDTVIRKTYGYKKSWDKISESQFRKATGIQTHIHEVIISCLEHRLIERKRSNQSYSYKLNKDYEQWVPYSMAGKRVLPERGEGTTEKGTTEKGRKVLPKRGENPLPKRGDTKERKKSNKDILFKEFWNEYPRKIAKTKVEKIYLSKQFNITVEKHSGIMAGLQRYKKSGQWSDPQFIPYPATWLNQERWNDEMPESDKPKQERHKLGY